MSVREPREQEYAAIFEETYTSLQQRRKIDPAFTIDDIRGFLRALYEQEGNDWEGRGPVYDTFISATIAAYERMMVEWKAELGQG